MMARSRGSNSRPTRSTPSFSATARIRIEDTGLSRAFFDQADHGHKGYLTGLDLVDAIRFEMIDAHHRGYFDFNELLAGLKTIGR
jgi:hypothetical protein